MTAFPFTDFPTTLSAPTGGTFTITPINSLATGQSAVLALVIDNRLTARWDEIAVELILGSLAVSSGVMEGLLIPSLDGTNFISLAGGANFGIGADSVPSAQCPIDPTTAAKRGILHFKGCRPYYYKLMIRNGLGATFPATGNSATWRGIVRETR